MSHLLLRTLACWRYIRTTYEQMRKRGLRLSRRHGRWCGGIFFCGRSSFSPTPRERAYRRHTVRRRGRQTVRSFLRSQNKKGSITSRSLALTRCFRSERCSLIIPVEFGDGVLTSHSAQGFDDGEKSSGARAVVALLYENVVPRLHVPDRHG